MSRRSCHKCGAPATQDASFCERCGAKLEARAWLVAPLLLLAYLGAGVLAWAMACFVWAISLTDETRAQQASGFYTGTATAVAVTLAGAVLIGVPRSRRALELDRWERLLSLDGAIGVGTLVGLIAGM
jgi:uncharacterized paraquat-inducible protein A